MFDRKVHHLDKDGNLVRTTPFTEIVTIGFPNCLVRNGKFYCEDGTAYPEHLLGQVLNPNLKQKHRPDLLTVAECKKFGFQLPEHLIGDEEKLEDTTGEVVKRRGRPAAKKEEPEEVKQ